MKTDKQNKKEKLSKLLDGIDEKYTAEALEVRRRSSVLPKIAAAAACVALAVTATVMLPVMSRSSSNVITETDHEIEAVTDIGNTTESSGESKTPEKISPVRPYKSGVGSTGELAYVWFWEDMAPIERFTHFILNGMEYSTRAALISEDKLGDSLGSAVFKGYDAGTNTEYTESFELFEIRDISSEYLVAACIEGEHVVFINRDVTAPETFGELMDSLALAENLSFETFSLNERYRPQDHYRLDGDRKIWDILSFCDTAPLCPEDVPDFSGERYLSFTATSEALGIYKMVFSVTDDGYVTTNICEYGYTYYIGKDAAEEIFDYCLDMGKKAEAEPYMYYIYGYVTEVSDGYFLIDDSEVCSDPDDGLIFKVKTDDIRVGRYVKHGIVKEGAFISIHFKGEITEKCEIKNVQYITEAYYHGGDVVVLE